MNITGQQPLARTCLTKQQHGQRGRCKYLTDIHHMLHDGMGTDDSELFRLTPLEDSFSCNFNILIAGMPRVMGVREILNEWTAFRTECVRRRTYFDLNGKEKRLHLLKGLEAILLDIDKAVRIVRETAE